MINTLISDTNECSIKYSDGGSTKLGMVPIEIARQLEVKCKELSDALQTLLDSVEGNHVTVGDCNQARLAIKDAERYRWLRSSDTSTGVLSKVLRSAHSEDRSVAAIDKAMNEGNLI